MNLKGSRKEGNKYQNPVPTFQPGFNVVLPIIKEYIYHSAENKPKQPLGPFHTNTSIYQIPPESGLRITLFGHSSLLIEVDGRRILTDPVWSKRASFSQYFGPKRFFEPPLPLNELPALDAILLSHDHYDHLDMATIKHFAGTSIPFFCSLGVGQHLRRWGIKSNFITELDWGDSALIDHDCVITATPARHFSGRGITHRDETLWSSFVIKGKQHRIFFGADSG